MGGGGGGGMDGGVADAMLQRGAGVDGLQGGLGAGPHGGVALLAGG